LEAKIKALQKQILDLGGSVPEEKELEMLAQQLVEA